jgi:hypothetical protein
MVPLGLNDEKGNASHDRELDNCEWGSDEPALIQRELSRQRTKSSFWSWTCAQPRG